MASGWWDDNGAISGCVAAYRAIGVASLAASYSNLNAPGTNDLAVGSAVGLDATYGWTFDGTRRYLKTGIASYQPMTVIVRARTTSLASYRTWISVEGGAGGWHLYHTINSGSVGKADLTRGGATAIGTSSGTYPSDGTSFVVAVTFTATDDWVFYKDGTPNGSGTTSVPAFAGLPITIGDGVHNLHHYGTIAAVSMYSGVLTPGQVATLTAAMNALAASSSHPSILHAAQRAAFA